MGLYVQEIFFSEKNALLLSSMSLINTMGTLHLQLNPLKNAFPNFGVIALARVTP